MNGRSRPHQVHDAVDHDQRLVDLGVATMFGLRPVLMRDVYTPM
jgi:hypothetical protein